MALTSTILPCTIYRRSHAPTINLGQISSDGMCISESQSVILDPLKFSAQIIRNISGPTAAFPGVDIQLHLDHVKVREYEYDRRY